MNTMEERGVLKLFNFFFTIKSLAILVICHLISLLLKKLFQFEYLFIDYVLHYFEQNVINVF